MRGFVSRSKTSNKASASSLPSRPERGLLFILSAPAGTGKTTLMQMLIDKVPGVISSISYTTRLQRPGETDGVHYHFISNAEFAERISKGEFLEYVELYGCYYGTSKLWVEQQRAAVKHVFLVIDTQGAAQLKAKSDAVLIFMAPPSLEELERRLKQRMTETPAVIAKRLSWAEQEMQAWPEYDYLILNDQLPTAYDALRSIVVAEEHRIR